MTKLREPIEPTTRIFSFGGGVQSNAVLVLAAQGKVKYDAFVFANVGHDSENPATIEYIEKYSKPFAEKHGIEFVETYRFRRGKRLTLLQVAMEDNRSIPPPVYLQSGAPGNRTCTVDFKVRVIARWCKQNGHKSIVTGLGISTDEIHRAKTSELAWDKTTRTWKKLEYPLIDLSLSRADCHRIIQGAGLPVAPKSSCWFCPYHRLSTWVEMRRDQPDLFDKAVALEKRLNEKRGLLGKDRVTLHKSGLPLDQVIGLQDNFFNEFDMCESGYCMV